MIKWIEKAKDIPDLKEQAARARMHFQEALHELEYNIPTAYQALADKMEKIQILKTEIKILLEECEAITAQAKAARQEKAAFTALSHAFHMKTTQIAHKKNKIAELQDEFNHWLRYTRDLRADVFDNLLKGHNSVHKIKDYL